MVHWRRRRPVLDTLSLVIPAYNEERRLPALLDVLSHSAKDVVARAGFDLVETLVVDDGSSDRTRQILEQATAGDLALKPVLDLSVNRGKGAAVAAGVAHARGQYVLLADVDLSTPLEELEKLAEARHRGDIVIGSRAAAGAVVDRGPAYRKLTGRAFSGAVRALTGLQIRDTQNGFKLLPTEAAKELFAEQVCPGFAFDVELLLRADLAGMRIVEVPVLYVHDVRSRVRVAPASLQMLTEVAELARRLKPRSARSDESRPWPGGPLATARTDEQD
jgi:dolichyl-phosphate beta-glucosyltransferase